MRLRRSQYSKPPKGEWLRCLPRDGEHGTFDIRLRFASSILRSQLMRLQPPERWRAQHLWLWVQGCQEEVNTLPRRYDDAVDPVLYLLSAEASRKVHCSLCEEEIPLDAIQASYFHEPFVGRRQKNFGCSLLCAKGHLLRRFLLEAKDDIQPPEELGEEVDYLTQAVEELKAKGGGVIFCPRCAAVIPDEALRVDNFDDHVAPLAGGAGRRVICPEGHEITRVFDVIY